MNEPTLPTVSQCNLWSAVYAVVLVRPYGSHSEAVDAADCAVAAMTERMPTIATRAQIDELILSMADLRYQVAELQARGK